MQPKSLKSKDREYYLFALRIAGDFGGIIAIPVVVLVLIGRALDKKFNTGIWLTVAGFVLSAIISGVIIYRKSKQYGAEFQAMIDKK